MTLPRSPRGLVPLSLALAASLPVVLAALPAAGGTGRFVDYLYLEPNEGGASAGHVALGFADRVYHFERFPGGLLRLERDDAAHFRYLYAALGNRAIHVTRVAVSDETYALLEEGFNTRYLIQRRQLAALESLRTDERLLDVFLRRARAAATTIDVAPLPDTQAGSPWSNEGERDADALAIEGAGFFFPEERPGERSPSLVALGERVAESRGQDFIARRSADLRSWLEHVEPGADDLPPAMLSPEVYLSGQSFSDRYADLMAGIAALEVLREAPSLRREAIFAPATSDVEIEPQERALLAAYSLALADQLVRLTGLERPGWGFTLLVGMARLEAIRLSLESGRWVLLDATPPDHLRIDRHVVARALGDPALLGGLREEAQADFAAARAELVAHPGFGEREYARLETTGDRFCELARAADAGTDVRMHDGPYLPSLPAARTDLVVPGLNVARLEQTRAEVARAQRAYERELTRLYGYHLIAHNCVTELFRTIDASLGPRPEAASRSLGPRPLDAAAESRARLGGYVAADGSLTFIPFLSQSAVRQAYQVDGTREIPSYRTQRLAELDRRESPLLVSLRESNTLSSTVYRRSADDSYFLFFTDGTPAARPLLGAANLAVGLGAGIAGLALLPADGGEVLVAGLKGAVFSLPELVFVNIRKGSFDHVDRRYHPASPELSTR